MNSTAPLMQGAKIPAMFYTGVEIAGFVLALLLLHVILRALFTKGNILKNGISLNFSSKTIKIWHFTNVGIFFILLVSGLLAWCKLLPKSIFLPTHLVFAIAFIFSWTFLVAYNALGNYENYRIKKGFFADMFLQIKYYTFGIFKGEKNPHKEIEGSRFNALQSFSYLLLVYFLMPLFIITGMLEQIESIHKLMMQVHIFFCTLVSVLFVMIHVYMAVFCNTSKKEEVRG
ncbi:MAG: cytochrome b/b6 domain-containing protein [Campylobacteraceae bacterium]